MEKRSLVSVTPPAQNRPAPFFWFGGTSVPLDEVENLKIDIHLLWVGDLG